MLNTDTSTTVSESFTVDIIDSCVSAVVNPGVLSDVTYTDGDSSLPINVNAFSIVPAICGALTYSVVSPNPLPSYASFSASQVTVY